MAGALVFLLTLLFLVPSEAKANECPYSNEQIANAIYLAEGGAKTSHPYGILAHYKHTTPRQACLNTINSARKRFVKQNKEKDFVHFISLTYCPINCENDNGTNRFWYANVTMFLERSIK